MAGRRIARSYLEDRLVVACRQAGQPPNQMVRANHTMLLEDNSLQSNTKRPQKPSIQSVMEVV